MYSYTKRHLSLDEQLELLISRGLNVPNHLRAKQLLGEIGYYKVSGYSYPFRAISSVDNSGFVKRAEFFQPDVDFETIIKLYQFDSQLRVLLFQALANFELNLRSFLAYELGKIDPYFHLHRGNLDSRTSNKEHVNWMSFYYRDKDRSKTKDFVKHFDTRYGGEMPIWVAIEVMQFGTVKKLLELLSDREKSIVAERIGINSKPLFQNLVTSFLDLRNQCSHLSIIWNAKHGPDLNSFERHWGDKPELFHVDETQKNKLYGKLVALIQISRFLDSASEFPNKIKTLIEAFPAVPVVSPEADMGFHEKWRNLDFWQSI
jgi:abortive infection bacteriophage resistance protein